jgi:O-antigen/teichoic acid export membrane protein
MMLAIMYIADSGLSSSFSREASKEANKRNLLDILFSTEVCLYGILVSLGALIFLNSSFIVENWMHDIQPGDKAIVIDCLSIMPFALIPQIAMSLYYGGFMGLEHQVKANFFISFFTVCRSGLVILPIYIWPDIRVFFIWQAIVSWSFVLAMRHFLIKDVYRIKYRAKFSWSLLKPMRSYASGMFIMSVLAGLNTQLDKIIVSKYQSLENFGYYSLASIIAQIPIIFTTPIALALLPRFTKILNEGEVFKLKKLYELNTYVIATISSTASFGLLYFSKNIVELWLPSSGYSADMIMTLQILSIGSLFLCLQLMPYHLSLANGHTKTNRNLGFIILCFSIPSVIYLTKNYGIIGASTNWLILNLFAFFYLGYKLNIKFNNGCVYNWFLKYTIIPIIISLVIMSFASILISITEYNNISKILLAAFFSVISLGASALIFSLMKR